MGYGDLTGMYLDGHTRCLNTDIVFEHEFLEWHEYFLNTDLTVTRIFTQDFFEHELNE